MKNLTILALIAKLQQRVDSWETVQGEKGEKGDTGEQGLQGRQGDKGDIGPAGKDGTDGKEGKEGKEGKKGVSVVDAYTTADDNIVFVLSDGSELPVEVDLGSGKAGDTYISTTGNTSATSRSISVFDVDIDQLQEYSYITSGNAWQEAGCITIPQGNTEDFYIRVYAQEVGNPANVFFGVYAGLAQNLTGHTVIQNLETITRKTTDNRVSFRVTETPAEICGEVRPGLGETWEFKIDYTRQILWQS